MNARVLVVHSSYPPDSPGGAELTVRAYSTGLAEFGHEVRVLALTPGPTVRTDRDGPVEVLRIPAAWFNGYWPFGEAGRPATGRRALWHVRDLWSPRALRTVSRAIASFAPDVAVVNNLAGWSLAPLVAVGRAELPTALVLHDYGFMCVRRTMQTDSSTCVGTCLVCRPRAVAVRTLVDVKTVMPVSEALMTRYQRAGLFQDQDVRVFHPPITQCPLDTTRQWRYGYLGRIHASKGLVDLLDAARTAGERVAVAGTGDEDYLDRLRQEYVDVADWLGWVAPEDLFGRIDTLVVPSRWDEPFGRVVVEAAAAGRHVIVADRPGLLEAARSTGVPVRSFPSGNVNALVALLRQPTPAPAGAPQIPGVAPMLETVQRLGALRLQGAAE